MKTDPRKCWIGAFIPGGTVAGLFAQAPPRAGAAQRQGSRRRAAKALMPPKTSRFAEGHPGREEAPIATMRGYTPGRASSATTATVQEGGGRGRNGLRHRTKKRPP